MKLWQHGLVVTIALGFGWCSLPACAQSDNSEIEIKGVLLKIIERADVPARQAGEIKTLLVKEGQIVKAGELLAQLDDAEALLTVKRADLEAQIAERKATVDVDVRAAEEEHRVAEGDFKNAKQAKERRSDSVSFSELEHLRLRATIKQLQVERTRHAHDIDLLTQQQRVSELELARVRLEQRRVTAPLAGVVVEVLQQRGEWVEPGERILRLIRLDRLRAEGFIDAQLAAQQLLGQPVTLKLDGGPKGPQSYPGKVVFISPEVDPVNRQTRIWAEIENAELSLLPGLRGQMVIRRDDQAAERRN
ncbi:MAG: efflux RND transporter periplasmic adaptor subunit [Planctomycetota bacterium]